MSIIVGSNCRRLHLYRRGTDMRKGFDSLCGIIKNELDQQVLNGDGFVFINKPRTHIKVLVWEHGGFTIYYRRLEKGTFELPASDDDAPGMQINFNQLHFILQGIALSTIRYRPRYQHFCAVR